MNLSSPLARNQETAVIKQMRLKKFLNRFIWSNSFCTFLFCTRCLKKGTWLWVVRKVWDLSDRNLNDGNQLSKITILFYNFLAYTHIQYKLQLQRFTKWRKFLLPNGKINIVLTNFQLNDILCKCQRNIFGFFGLLW